MRESGLVQGKRRAAGTAVDFAVGALLGIVVFLLVYGPGTLDVTYDSWIYHGYVEGDIIQRYAGWMYYRAAAWGWPLTVADNLAAPVGTAIAFTDSIPLAAVFCKLLGPVLPATFQYFGWYNLLNFALQGGFAVLLLRHFDFSRLYSALGSLLFVFAPVFLERVFRHDALASQWMVLAALLFYLRARRGRFPAIGFVVLASLAPGIHTYFVPMVYALFLAALCEYALREKKLLRPLLWLGAAFAGTLLMAYVLGILTRGGGGDAWGFGHYSMNLFALWNPASADFTAESGWMEWSRVLPALAVGEGQYDGFQYLGAGLLLAWLGLAGYGVFRLVSALRRGHGGVLAKAGRFLLSHAPLLVICLALSLFALSNVVQAGAATLFSLPLPEVVLRLCAVFRASGRLFWPCYYLLILTPLVFLGRVLPKRWPVVALAVLLAVQLCDLSGVLAQKHAYFARPLGEVENVYTTAEWRELMERYDEVYLLDDLFDYELAAGLIRYNPSRTTNLVLANRGDFTALQQAQLDERAALLGSGVPRPGVLYLTKDVGLYGQLLTVLPEGAEVHEVGDYYLFAAGGEGTGAANE